MLDKHAAVELFIDFEKYDIGKYRNALSLQFFFMNFKKYINLYLMLKINIVMHVLIFVKNYFKDYLKKGCALYTKY